MIKPGRKPKVDLLKLDKMLEAGKSNIECAKHFGVSSGAISHARKQLRRAYTKKTAVETHPEIYARQINAVDQMQKINRSANDMLDMMMAWMRGDEEAIRILESQVKYVIYRDKETGDDIKLGVKEVKLKDPRQIALGAMSEIRNQLDLQLKIFQSLYDVQAAKEFQDEVLKAIAEEKPDVRDRIVQRLHHKRAIRQLVKPPTQ